MKLKKILTSLMFGATVALTSMTASADPITIGGVTWDPDVPADFNSVGNMFEYLVQVPGDVASGYGRILEINSNDFCTDCQLTYTFGGFVLNSPDPDHLTFTGGWLKIWVQQTGPGYTAFNAANPATAGDGTLWMSLTAHSSTQQTLDGPVSGTLHGNITAGELGTGTETGKGSGLFDVVGGLAADRFNTNTKGDGNLIPGFADLLFTSTFGPTNNWTPGDTRGPLTGSGNLFGDSTGVPEPGSMLLLGLGLLGLAATAKRRQAK